MILARISIFCLSVEKTIVVSPDQAELCHHIGMNDPSLVTLEGGCHCGLVRFEVDTPAKVTVQDCNCSMCRMTGFVHLIVPAARFRLLSSPDALVEYRFNTGTARHLFCHRCGVKSYYVPRSNPDGFSVNFRCLEDISPLQVNWEKTFDGVNWEQHGHELAHRSRID